MLRLLACAGAVADIPGLISALPVEIAEHCLLAKIRPRGRESAFQVGRIRL
jgi:hypothetical protein